jgi:hypothetical protein
MALESSKVCEAQERTNVIVVPEDHGIGIQTPILPTAQIPGYCATPTGYRLRLALYKQMNSIEESVTGEEKVPRSVSLCCRVK